VDLHITGWWFGTFFIFPYIYILGIIIPTDFHIFQRGRSTTNQISSPMEWMVYGMTMDDPWPTLARGG